MMNIVLSKMKKCRENWGGNFLLRSLLAVSLFSQVAASTKAADDEESSTTTSSAIQVGDLAGSEPSDDLCTTDRPTKDNTKIFFLYNVGTGGFLYPGGFWGTHTSLNDVGFKLWLETGDNTDSGKKDYNIRTTLMTAENDISYLNYNNATNSLYMDQKKSDNPYGWYFDPVTEDGYTADSHVYRLYTKNNTGEKSIYLTANPTNTFPNYTTGPDYIYTENKNYQYWKLISLQEYYRLFQQTPAQLTKPVDATFVLKDPSFHVNNTNITKWEIQYPDNDPFMFGGAKCYKRIGDNEYCNYNTYQKNDGNYFFAFCKNGSKNGLRQIVAVHQPGWYIFTCNGFSSANTSETTNVMFYVTPTSQNGNTTEWSKVHATPLNVVSYAEAKSLMENESTNIGNNPEFPVNGEVAAGKAFAQGKYTNQVMYYVEEATETSPVYLQFGINILEHDLSENTEWTAFDNFRVLYAGKREVNKADLILDEEDTDLTHLTESNEDYDNVTLHLNRKFTLNKWNTLILPVSLKYGQMKNAFGDAVKLAKLWRLTENSVQFKTVTCTNNDETMLEAFVPYIIMVSNPQDITPGYTATLTKSDNSSTFTKEIGTNHYDISMVSLKRADITSRVNIRSDSDGNSIRDNWTTTYSGDGTTANGDAGTMTCIGSLGKTYGSDANGKTSIYNDRDNLAGAYFMKNGEMWKVPEVKLYGMKAFRCWFRLTAKTDQSLTSTAAAKEVKLWLDGIEDNSTTSISDVIMDDPFDIPTTYKATDNAIYNLNGQKVRQGIDTVGLPSGLYIIQGHKVMIR